MAKAFHENNVNFISISYGTFAYLTSFFDLVLSFPNLLREFANSEGEVAPLITLLKLNDNFADLLLGSDPMSAPKSDGRRWLAHYLADTAFAYIVHHEIAHLRHGHIGFLKELAMTKADASREDCWAMEYDSDCFAAMALINHAVEVESKLAAKVPCTSSEYSVRENSLFLNFFAVYMFFRVHVDIGSVYGHFSKTHPPAFQRMLGLLEMTIECDRRFGLLDNALLLKNARRVVSEGEATAASLTDGKLDLTGLEMAIETGNPMVPKLNQYWGDLRPKLVKHACSNL